VTDSIPIVTESDEALSAPPRGLIARIAASLDDPVLRVLTVSTFVGTLGRGVVLTATVLYLTIIVKLEPGQVALVMAIAAGVGVGTSYLGGHLADRFSARRLAITFAVLDGLALACYAFVDSFWSALVVACAAFAFERSGNSSRSAIIARAFDGPRRVHARAVLRTVTNLGISIGGALAGIALLLGTREAYSVALIAAGVVYVATSLPLRRLPASVDAAPRPTTDTGTIMTAPGRSPWRDRRYLALAALSGVFAMHFGLAEVGVPLWIAHETEAPEYLVSVLLIINTVLVVLFQVAASRGTHELRRAGTVTAISGVIMAAACLLYASAAGPALALAIALLVAGAVAHAAAEILSQAAAWGLSFELADPARAGAYQGVFAMGFSLGALASPLIVTATALTLGFWGWVILAAVFLLSALGITAIAYRAATARTAR
jgi:MFS family permease